MLEKDVIESNIEAVSRPLDDKELEVQNQLRKMFSDLNICHWEGLEVANYWSSMKSSKKDDV